MKKYVLVCVNASQKEENIIFEQLPFNRIFSPFFEK